MLPEPAGDLAVAAALMSSLRDKPLPAATVVFGEVGLAGEVRAVGQIEQRLAEAAQLGFTRCVLPEGNRTRSRPTALTLHGVKTIGGAMDALFA
jgi:DNA repair protein RadA/Sms